MSKLQLLRGRQTDRWSRLPVAVNQVVEGGELLFKWASFGSTKWQATSRLRKLQVLKLCWQDSFAYGKWFILVVQIFNWISQLKFFKYLQQVETFFNWNLAEWEAEPISAQVAFQTIFVSGDSLRHCPTQLNFKCKATDSKSHRSLPAEVKVKFQATHGSADSVHVCTDHLISPLKSNEKLESTKLEKDKCGAGGKTRVDTWPHLVTIFLFTIEISCLQWADR